MFFLDLIRETNLIPGSNSTAMVNYCGHERAGVSGFFVADILFCFSSRCYCWSFRWFYASFREFPEVAPFFDQASRVNYNCLSNFKTWLKSVEKLGDWNS